MLEDILLPAPPVDKYLRAADERAGACSILVGIAANESIRTGQQVKIASLMPQLRRPDFAPMPNRAVPLPMPVRSA